MKYLTLIACLQCLFILSFCQDVAKLFSGSRTVYSQFSPGPQHGVPVFFSQTAKILPTDYEVASAVTTIYNYEPTQGVFFGVNCIKLVSNLYCVVSMDNRVEWNRFTFNFFVSARQDLRCGVFNKVFTSNGSHQIYQPLPTPWNGQNQNPQFLILIPFIAGINTLDKNFGVKITERSFQLAIQMISVKISIVQLNASEVLIDFAYLLLQLSSNYQVQNDIDLDYFQTDLDQFNGISEIRFLPQSNKATPSTSAASATPITSVRLVLGSNINSLGSNINTDLKQDSVFPTARIQPNTNQGIAVEQTFKSAPNSNNLQTVNSPHSTVNVETLSYYDKKAEIFNDKNFAIANSQIAPPTDNCFISIKNNFKSQSFSPQDASRFRSFFRVSGLVFKVNQFEVARASITLTSSPTDLCRRLGGNYVASFQPLEINQTFQYLSSQNNQKETKNIQKLTNRCIICAKNQQFSATKKSCVANLDQKLIIRNPVPVLKSYAIQRFGSIFIYRPQSNQFSILQTDIYKS